MRPMPRHLLSYASFVALLALDAVALVALLLIQVLALPMPAAWLVSILLAAIASPALLRLADKVFAMARNSRTIPHTGESFL